jgi:hypothetical protein
MKRYFLLTALALGFFTLKAQTLEEWTQQKKTGVKYLVQQIAALKVYTQYLNKGIDIVQSGLSTISQLKKGDVAQHATYFQSLHKVNPALQHYSKAIGTMAAVASVLQEYKQLNQKTRNSKELSVPEKEYVLKVAKEILQACLDRTEELALLTQSGSVQLKDDERLKRIHIIYKEIKEVQAAIKSLSEDVAGMSLQRKAEGRNIQISKSLYGIYH